MRVLSIILLVRSVFCGVGADYHVGPGHDLADPNEVAWEALRAGDRIFIHARQEPYRSKFVLCCRGTEQAPIRVIGVKDREGRRPVLDGKGALTRKQLNFWGEARAVIKIGGANRPSDVVPGFIEVHGLEVRGGRKPNSFMGREGRTGYARNAAAFYVEKGEHLLIEDCVIRDNGNGIITAPATRDLVVRGCHLFDNGVEGSLYEHNAYTTGIDVRFEFNRFGPLRPACLGNNFKDRSAGLSFRCNWVEGGNRCLDLVDAADAKILGHPLYRRTLVWGNVMWKTPGPGNNQVIHYGGDSGDLGRYRGGTLRLWNNTIVSLRSGNTVLVRPSERECRIECRQNIAHVVREDGRLFLLADAAELEAEGNWFSLGWQGVVGENLAAGADNASGTAPGFVDWRVGDLRLRSDSPLRRSIEKVLPPEGFGADGSEWQYRSHQDRSPRAAWTVPGAFE
jgi:hypothetical protein